MSARERVVALMVLDAGLLVAAGQHPNTDLQFFFGFLGTIVLFSILCHLMWEAQR